MHVCMYLCTYVSTVQLNLNLTLACESLEKFHEILASSTRSMYAHIMLCAISTAHTYVLCPLVPYHHQIQFVYSTRQYKHQNYSNHGQHTYIFNTDVAPKYRIPALPFIISDVAHTFYSTHSLLIRTSTGTQYIPTHCGCIKYVHYA